MIPTKALRTYPVLLCSALLALLVGGCGTSDESHNCTLHPHGTSPFGKPCEAVNREAKQEEESLNRADELTHDSPLRRRLMKAAEHLPPNASVEEMTVQAEAEAANPQKEPGTTCENHNPPAGSSQKTREALAAPCN
jgi:hypothetical protein